MITPSLSNHLALTKLMSLVNHYSDDHIELLSYLMDHSDRRILVITLDEFDKEQARVRIENALPTHIVKRSLLGLPPVELINFTDLSDFGVTSPMFMTVVLSKQLNKYLLSQELERLDVEIRKSSVPFLPTDFFWRVNDVNLSINRLRWFFIGTGCSSLFFFLLWYLL